MLNLTVTVTQIMIRNSLLNGSCNIPIIKGTNEYDLLTVLFVLILSYTAQCSKLFIESAIAHVIFLLRSSCIMQSRFCDNVHNLRTYVVDLQSPFIHYLLLCSVV